MKGGDVKKGDGKGKRESDEGNLRSKDGGG